MLSRMSETCILILHKDSPDDLIALVSEIRNQSYTDHVILVVDDNSSRENQQIVNNLKDLIIVPFQAPWIYGVPQKWDFGLRIANILSSKFTITIQTDMHSLSPDFLLNLVNCMKEDENLGMIGPTVISTEDNKVSWGPEVEKFRMGKKYVASECLILNNRALLDINFLNAKLRHFSDEFYLYNKLLLHGFSVKSIGAARIYHRGGGTSGRSSRSVKYRIILRARDTIIILRLFNKSDSFYKKFRYFLEENSEFFLLLRVNLLRIKVFDIVSSIVYFLYGVLSGLYVNCEE